jgi:hypothetical protein
MGGGPDINYPDQPSYGEGMADALKAQVELLTGTGDFASTGSLESLLPLEESIRRKTAQTDTDILRQTLLGSEQEVVRDPKTGKYGIPGAEPVQREGGESPAGARYQMLPYGKGNPINANNTNNFAILDTETGGVVPMYDMLKRDGYIDEAAGGRPFYTDKALNDGIVSRLSWVDESGGPLMDVFSEKYLTQAEESPGEFEQTYEFTNPNTGEPLKEGDVVRTGDGMLDLLGDKRAIQEFETRTATQADVDAGLASEVGEQFVTQSDSTRQAGFDEQGNFLGLSAFGEDIQRANLSRQREADLQDVSRLSPLFADIMEDYKPGTQEALGDARTILAEQADALTGAGAITIPSDSTYGGDLGRQSLEAATSYDPSASVTGGTYTGELGAGDDALRGALLADAKQALGQGLTDREQRQIAEAARARSTMMGRTFDQSGAIAEAEARVAEDNQRRMQNRAFAQRALGQEAGLQEADLGRGMQAQLTNQQATNQALQAGMAAGLGQEQAQAQLAQAANLAEQGQKQQAKQFGVGATMDAQRANEQLKQQGILGYIQAAGGLAALEDRTTLDPFQAVLGRGGGNALQQGQSVFGQAGYGLQSAPQYLNPEAGLGFIQNQATNAANMYSAQVAADATRDAGLMSGLGSLGGGLLGGAGAAASGGATLFSGFCWVAREVYGEKNPAWKMFRMWMFLESPNWFFNLYKKYGERFARFIKNKPRLKAIIRMWMDSKIRR